jgi:DNA-binding CsgD family transcriptional regulator
MVLRLPKFGERLTQAEVRVVAGLARGQTNAEIGKALFLSEVTVKSHLQRIGRKLGCGDRAEIVHVAYGIGYLSELPPQLPPQWRRPTGLSPRELEVLRCIAEGLTYRKIAERLGTGTETVKGVARLLFTRLRARGRAHAVALGHQRGLLVLSQERIHTLAMAAARTGTLTSGTSALAARPNALTA